MNEMDIGRAAKEIRLAKKMTQTDVCKKSGISNRSLCHIESGISEPTPASISRIAKGLDVSIPYLLLSSIYAEDIKPGQEQTFAVFCAAFKELIK